LDNLIDSQAGLMAGLVRTEAFSPEQKLWSRVLFEAIDCISGIVAGENRIENKKRIQDDARTWMSKDEDLGVGTFGWVCNVLDLNPPWVREVVMKNKLAWRNLRRRMEETECRKAVCGRLRTRFSLFEALGSIGAPGGRTFEAGLHGETS